MPNEPTALYRRYRPETFADVIGQEHVTEPLSQALRSGRINHAYLFSGPRGCGKTTSARILARCLNCEQGPTPTPCGVCDSCTDLARGGSGSLDVVEIDAASHGGVDDARELRERATMATARDRFKVYIIDEAHMVSPQGFNALLKLVEEPPEHVKFVFATTEPDKVLATIRSRTHHYPFHLVPPHVLTQYLAELCEREHVPVGKGVLPLVVRAGGGSVRDSLSVLDQLMAGAGDDGVDYARAAALLGYTDSALLDDVVGAIDAVDGATLFTVVDRVIESGHDPRRFVEDLLERLRDLIVVQALGDKAGGVLRGLPPDQLDRMGTQSATLGAATLSRAADIVNGALTEMVGASSPRLHLELLCARLLLPAAEPGTRGLGARIDRIERRLGVTDGAVAAAGGVPVPAPAPAAAQPAGRPHPPAPAPDVAGPEPVAVRPANAPPPAVDEPAADARPTPAAVANRAKNPAPMPSPAPASSPAASPAPSASPAPEATEPPPQPPPDAGALDTAAVRRAWTGILERVRADTKFTWMMLSDKVHVQEYENGVLRLAFTSPGAAKNFAAGRHPEVVQRALADELALVARIEAVTTEGVPSPPAAPLPRSQPTQTHADDHTDATDHVATDHVATDHVATDHVATDHDTDRGSTAPTAGASAPRRPGRTGSSRATTPRVAQPAVSPEDDVAADDDEDAEDSGLVGRPVVEQMLGGRVIEE